MDRYRIVAALGWGLCIAMLAAMWSSSGSTWERRAAADMIASGGGFTLVAANSRDQRVPEESEVIYLLDHHRGMMMVYGLRDVHTTPFIELLDAGRIEVLFERARAAARRAKP
jgi:hypothetical protein